jgi:hypothetical protein
MPMRPLKPLARATRVAPFVARQVPSTLSRALEEELFRAADVMSEGDCRPGGLGARSYFGSTMIRIPVASLGGRVRGTLDEASCRALAEAVDGSARVRLRAMRLAIREAERRVPDHALGTAQVEIQVRLDGEHLRIDIDLEVPVGVSSRAGLR